MFFSTAALQVPPFNVVKQEITLRDKFCAFYIYVYFIYQTQFDSNILHAFYCAFYFLLNLNIVLSFVILMSTLLCFSLFYFLLLTAKHTWPFSVFTEKICQIKADLYKILHTPIVVRNTLVCQRRPRSACGRLQAKPERLCF